MERTLSGEGVRSCDREQIAELLGELDRNAESAEWMFAPIFADAAALIRALLIELDHVNAR